jgi:ATPase family protein associated with various cellular activities (AAA)
MHSKTKLLQWGLQEGGAFTPVGSTTERLPAGTYYFQLGVGLSIVPVHQVLDNLVELPSDTCAEVLQSMEKFWLSEHRYREHGLLYKRGLLLHGNPGSGKTATIALVSKKLIEDDGLVFFFRGLATEVGLQAVRASEPRRRIVCIMEDLDDIVEHYGEDHVEALLDGNLQIDGIVWLATTNHLDKLPQALINRPSRFDEVLEVRMPSLEARMGYLHQVAPKLDATEMGRWVEDTEGFSIAHIKELAAAVLCLDHPYEKALRRLRTMAGLAAAPKPKQSLGPVAKLSHEEAVEMLEIPSQMLTENEVECTVNS